MKNLMSMAFTTTILLFPLLSQAETTDKTVIYGEDNRKDLYEVQNSKYLKLASSTAGMVTMNLFKKGVDQYHFDFSTAPSLERAHNICPNEAFSQQRLAPNCTAFLVAPDVMVTAGHCFMSKGRPLEVCKTTAIVFDYAMNTSSDDPTKDISAQNTFFCKRVFLAKDQRNDYAVIKLDRAVTGRSPLKMRPFGSVDPRAHLVVIGHPNGLPMKVADGGRVVKNDNPIKFYASVDTFQGNSGSGVFDANTGLLEGILIEGKPDYLPSKRNDPKSCLVVNRCEDNGDNCLVDYPLARRSQGEAVLRIGDLQKIVGEIASMP